MAKAYYIPNGTKNLQEMFPVVDFTQVSEYYLELIDDNDTIVATTTKTQVCGCEDPAEIRRVHFLNAVGGMDAINFILAEEDHEVTSEQYQVPTTIPLDKSAHTTGRFNVAAGDIVTVITTDWGEKDREWLKELFDTPLAWLEEKGVQGQPDTYMPIIIQSATFKTVKREERYVYETTLQYSFSNDKFIIRN